MPRSGFEPTLDRTIECTLRAPAEARRACEQLAPEVEQAVLRDVQLVVSELVTNSVRHSGSGEPIRLRAWAKANGLKVEIADAGRGFEPADDAGDVESEGGRGLLILESLADRWGVNLDAYTRVWFEISQRRQSGRRAQAG
jgi:anti-sigma regulatory factor (Ser/Thr protein kinase)